MAFDTVDHQLLLDQPAFRVSLTMNSTHFVSIAEARYDHQLLTSGVPQGSVLGTIFYHLHSAPGGHHVEAYYEVSLVH